MREERSLLLRSQYRKKFTALVETKDSEEESKEEEKIPSCRRGRKVRRDERGGSEGGTRR